MGSLLCEARASPLPQKQKGRLRSALFILINLGSVLLRRQRDVVKRNQVTTATGILSRQRELK